MSTLLKKRRPTTSGAQTGPSSSKKQRLIDGTKMLLDVAKESADACAPLKSCLGGICALIKHYEESKDVEEKLGDLILWLTKLKGSITVARADDNPHDVERREQLEQSLKDIEKRSLELSKKSVGVRFFDKKQDSGIVVKLVEDLRQAILIYQLSQQRSIDNQVAQLTSSFNEFLIIRKRPQKLKENVKSILKKLGRLNVKGSTPGDQDEFKRTILLFEAFEGIKDELMPISARSDAADYKENDADVYAMYALAQNVRDAIMEYQFAQQKAIYEQACRLIDLGEQTVLNSYRRARGAGYQHGNRNGCLKGTRESVLEHIERWTEDSQRSPVFWLNGLAGTGKTTIAQTIAERVFVEGRLGASFFCSRDFEDRSDLRFMFPALAFQLAYSYPDFRSRFVSLLRANPDVVYESLYNQMQKLIVEPLLAAGVSTVIVIDALDECKDDEPSSAILSVLGRFVGQIPDVKFFITGRPEPRIKTGFRLPLLIDSTYVFVLHDVPPSLVYDDIRLFLEHELSGIAQRRQLGEWPTGKNIDVLCDRAAGLFVYAVATVKFLDSNTHLPKHRLDVILELPENTVPEGTTPFKPETTLDSLYTSILQTAFSKKDPGVHSKVRAVVGTVVMVVNPLPPRAIAELIDVEPEEVTLFLALIQSLLAISEDSSQPVKPFHKSFPDFIADPSRCPDPRFLISPGDIHFQLVMNCLRVMDDGLEQNLLSLPEFALNSEVVDLQTRIDDRISITLQYACRSWNSHLIKTKEDSVSDIIPRLRTFLEEKFLSWLEVLSVLGDVGGAVVALENLMSWLQKFAKHDNLLDTVRDCFRFVTKFFEPINSSAPHIYHSALELCPASSIVRQSYYDRTGRADHLPRIVVGTPDYWDPIISISGKDDYKFCTWSPCGRFIAALTGNFVEIRNQLTFELLTTLRPTATAFLLIGPLTYSPDGRSLACPSKTAIVIWDIQTGGVAKEIVCGARITSLTWSLDGCTIGTLESLSSDARHTGTHVNTYNVTSDTPLFLETIHSSHKPHLWAYEKSFRVMTTERYPLDRTKIRIRLRDFGVQSLITTCTFNVTIKAQAGDNHTDYPPESEIVSFSPSTYRVSLSVGNELVVFQGPIPVSLLKENGHFLSSCFSSDGSLFAASKETNVIIWEYSSGHYVRWREFVCQGWTNSQFSTTPSSLLSHSRNILQMSHLGDLPTVYEPRRRRHAALSRSGSCIAIAHELETTITIFHPLSKSSPHRIYTSMWIEGFFLTSNVLLVVGPGQAMAWLLTEEGPVNGMFDGRALIHSARIWVIPLRSTHDIIARAVSLTRPKSELRLHVEGQIGVIEHDTIGRFLYHTETGEILQPDQTPLHLRSPGLNIADGLSGRHSLYCHNLSQCNTPPDGSWYPSETTLQEGWVKDPEGRHRLWLHVEWRTSWDRADWRHNVTTQFSMIGDQPLIIKF